jgi:hypothetical protein
LREKQLTGRDTFAEKVISFYRSLDFTGSLPQGISVMNPYKKNREILQVASLFYRKFYNDHERRIIILGINPGRFGAGVTGIPFTDTRRLREKCGIKVESADTRELSSEFIYQMIDEFGGVEKFYSVFFVSAVCPLGFTSAGKKGREVNYNYYDSHELTASVHDFISDTLVKQIDFGINTDICFCLGTGKNFRFLSDLNSKMGFFGKIIPIEHPRFIMQYRRKKKQIYIDSYLNLFRRVTKGCRESC